jgi:hypothetical protein
MQAFVPLNEKKSANQLQDLCTVDSLTRAETPGGNRAISCDAGSINRGSYLTFAFNLGK